MKKYFLSILLLMPLNSNAEIAVFVHGFQSSANIWRDSHVFRPLNNSGWKDAGGFRYWGRQIVGPNQRGDGEKLMYTVDLPGNAPIMFQVEFLHAVIRSIQNFAKKEPISLIGHSAGGLVARAAMVAYPVAEIKQLITIATPNLGTGKAKAGALLAGSPVGMFARMMGENNLSHSGQLLSDLAPPNRYNFLGWLNAQPHPEADYIAIVRSDKGLLKGDALIDPESQDLRNVWALQNHADAFWSTGSHSLAAQDGDILATLLMRSKTQ